MNISIKLAAIVAITLVSVSANAELVKTDWKTQGDGLATLDTQSGLEWLDVDQTTSLSMNQVIAQLDTSFSGWRLPSVREVHAFIDRAMPLQSLHRTHENASGGYWAPSDQAIEDEAVAFQSFVGITHSDDRYGEYSYVNYVNDEQEINGLASILFYGVVTGRQNSDNRTHIRIDSKYSDSYDSPSPAYGVFLVSDGGATLTSINNPSINSATNVSSPLSFGLVTMGLLSLAGLRRKQK